MMQGWQCPKCGRVNAPWVGTCPCYMEKKEQKNITYTIGTPGYKQEPGRTWCTTTGTCECKEEDEK